MAFGVFCGPLEQPVCQSLFHAQVPVPVSLACHVFHSSGHPISVANSRSPTHGRAEWPLLSVYVGQPSRHTPGTLVGPQRRHASAWPPGVLAACSRMITALSPHSSTSPFMALLPRGLKDLIRKWHRMAPCGGPWVSMVIRARRQPDIESVPDDAHFAEAEASSVRPGCLPCWLGPHGSRTLRTFINTILLLSPGATADSSLSWSLSPLPCPQS